MLSRSLLDTHDSVPEDVTSVLPIDYASIDRAVYYLPPDVRAKMGPSAGPSGDAVCRGYIAVFKIIMDLLPDDDIPEPQSFPDVAAVSARLAPFSKPSSTPDAAGPDTKSSNKDAEGNSASELAAFLGGGGLATHALDCIVDRAREEFAPRGSEYDAECEYIDQVLEGGGGAPRPKCANDLDFALVRARLGLPADTLGVVPEGEEDWRDPVSDDED